MNRVAVNPIKTTVVLFMQKINLEGLNLPVLKGVNLSPSGSEMSRDNSTKLTSKTYDELKVNRALKVLGDHGRNQQLRLQLELDGIWYGIEK